MAQEYHANGTEYFRPVEPLGSPGGSAKGALANLVAALAALALAAASLFFPHVDCTPIDIQRTTALLETELFNREEDQEVSWFLTTGSNITILPPLDTVELTKLLEDLTTIYLTNLTPGTEYTIVFTTPGEDGEPTLLDTFTFRTPGDPPAAPPPEDSEPSITPPVTTQPPSEPTTETATETTSEPTTETTTETTRPTGGGGGGNDGGDDGGWSGGGGTTTLPPPTAGTTSMGSFMEPGSLADGTQHNGYFLLTFPFQTNGYTVDSVRVIGSRTVYPGFSPDLSLSPTVEDTFLPGDSQLSTSGNTTTLTYVLWDPHAGANLQAVLSYTDTSGNTAYEYSNFFTYIPSYLYDDPTQNSVTATVEGTDVRFKVNVGSFSKGTVDFLVSSVYVYNSDGDQSHVDTQGLNLRPTGPFSLEFVLPLSFFTDDQGVLTNDQVTVIVDGDSVYGDSHICIPSSTTFTGTITGYSFFSLPVEGEEAQPAPAEEATPPREETQEPDANLPPEEPQTEAASEPGSEEEQPQNDLPEEPGEDLTPSDPGEAPTPSDPSEDPPTP